MGSGLVAEKDGYSLGLEETELRLGLPVGRGSEGDGAKHSGKKGFSETIDLKPKLQTVVDSKEVKMEASDKMKRSPSQMDIFPPINDPEKPSAPKYKNDPEILAMTNLIAAYQRNEILEFEKNLKSNRRTIMDDPFIRNYIEDLLKNIRTQVLLKLVKPYTRIRIPFISKQSGWASI